jgi:His/Glu/Gln/Arg/opine family amino acid ABC transporter permease subunit
MNIWDDFYNSIIYDDRYMYILEGIKDTVLIAFFAVIIGILLGLIIALINNYHKETGKLKVLNFIASFYVTIIRGTPTLLQLMIIYYIIFKSVTINILFVGVLAFGLNSAAYVSEIIRAGLDSIDVGQKEAAYSLGLKYRQVMASVVMPQAIKNILPALGNEFITLLKETSVGSYIGIVELTKAGDIIASRTYNYFFPLIIVAVCYLILTLGLSKILNVFEKRLK